MRRSILAIVTADPRFRLAVLPGLPEGLSYGVMAPDEFIRRTAEGAIWGAFVDGALLCTQGYRGGRSPLSC